MHLAIGLALKCALSEQQICSLEWADIHRQDKVLRVSSKPAYGFRVKDSEQRNIPPPDDLLAEPITINSEIHSRGRPSIVSRTYPKSTSCGFA